MATEFYLDYEGSGSAAARFATKGADLDWVDSLFEHEEWRDSTRYAFEEAAKALDDERDTVLTTLQTRSRPAVSALDAEGYAGFLSSYLWEQLTGSNHTEEDAGLEDGGY